MLRCMQVFVWHAGSARVLCRMQVLPGSCVACRFLCGMQVLLGSCVACRFCQGLSSHTGFARVLCCMQVLPDDVAIELPGGAGLHCAAEQLHAVLHLSHAHPLHHHGVRCPGSGPQIQQKQCWHHLQVGTTTIHVTVLLVICLLLVMWHDCVHSLHGHEGQGSNTLDVRFVSQTTH